MLIDEQLRLSGWEADTQNLRYSKGTRPVKGRNIAISEWPTNSAFYKNGYADYAFFVSEKLVALMDAKKMSEDVASTIDVQVKDYAAHIKPEDIPHTVGNWNGYQVPFLFASNGRAYLEQLRTKSGIWFLDVREQENQPYPIRNWFSPSDLMEKLGQNTAAANQALAAADNSFMTDPNGLNLRDYQIKAIDKATEAIVDGKRTALLAMATGTGKTRTVLGLIYKMLESKRFRRILFLVDRVSLGEQAMDTFKDEIYCDLGGDLTEQAIQKYNDCLDDWEKRQGYEIISDGNAACIAAYEASTLFILNKLLELSQIHNKGQKEVNEKYLRNCDIAFSDPKKEEALKYAFVNSRVLLVYGAAGTGKTTLIDMIPTMLSGRRKLFLTKTHTALQNLQRRINNPGADASFVSINSFTKRVNLPDYDVIFVDECSTIDNRAMKVFLEKMRPDTFLVLAGDTYQIESIDFGNWFTYAKDIIKTKGSNVELVSTWRTKDPGLIELWNETRNKGALITEKLVIDGPFSENIGEGVLNSEIMDEVILCLNYDGKFGLNNMNSYFQNANTGTAVVWRDWKYKVGDHILFNDTDRFSLLYNNLKGRIVQIELFDSRIRFTVDVEIPLTEQDCQNDGIEFIDIIDDVTRIRFDVLDFEEEMADEDRKKAIVPFQLAYAVSIHKAQGLEYRSVKVVIPSSNAEKITHGIFYTAITRAKEKLKIYWSSETMQEVVAGFSVDTSKQKSLAIIKEKLKQDKNT